MKKIYLTILVSILFSISVFSQNQNMQTIRGRLVDSQSEIPIVGATVMIFDNSNIPVTATDSKGEFTLENVPLGRQSVEISFIGYNTISLRNLMIVRGKETVLDLKMEEKVVNVQQIVITAQKDKTNTNNEMAVSGRSFSIEETERYAGSLGDPSRMAANFAGVMSVADQRNDIVIRGNSPSGLLWRLNGIDIPNPNHFGSTGSTGGPVSMLNNNVLANSDFFTGAFPAEYGNALSGVFDLKMRHGNNKKFEFLGQVGFNGFELGVEGPLSKKSGASFLINARYSTLEVMSKLGFTAGTGAAVPQYKDITFNLNLPRGKFGKLTLFGIGGLSYIEMLDSQGDSSEFGFGGTDLRYGSDMGVVGLNHTFFFNNSTRIVTKFSIAGTNITTKLDSLDKDMNYNFRFYGGNTFEARGQGGLELHKKFNAKNYLMIGVKFNQLYFDLLDSVYTSDTTDYVSAFDTKEYMSFIQGYVQYQHKFTNNLKINLGIYGQYLPFNQTYAAEPRFGISWNFTEKMAINLGAGMHSQMQLPMFYMLENSDNIRTNEDLDFSRSLQLVLGYDYVINPNLRLKIETYYQHLYDIPVTDQQPQFSMLNLGDDFTSFAYHDMVNQGTGTNYGFEFTFEKFFSKGFYFLVTTSIFESKFTGFDEIERNTKFNGNFVYNGLGGYEFNVGKNAILALDLKGVYAGGKRYIPIDVEASKLASTGILDWDEAYENKHDDYFRINARITFKLNSNKKNFSQEWAVDIQNITNHQNIYAQRWDVHTNEIRTDYQQGIFPMMTYRILF